MEKQLLEKLYAEDRNAVRDILHSSEQDWDIVDDLMQDVFLRAAEAAYDGLCTPLTWLCAIAKHVAVDHVREQSADKRSFQVLASGISGKPGEVVEYYDRTDLSSGAEYATANLDPARVVEALDTYHKAAVGMPVVMARAVKMRREGHSNGDIAKALGRSEKTVRNLMSGAHKYFRDNPDFNTTNRPYEQGSEGEDSSLLDLASVCEASMKDRE